MKQAVYFILSSDGLIKIGRSASAIKRLANLQVSTASRLKLLGVVAPDTAQERELHQRFAESRVGGEWFKPSADLLAWINQNARPAHEIQPPQDRAVIDAEMALASDLVRRLAEPSFATDTIKSKIARAWQKLPDTWTRNRVRDIWLRDPRARIHLSEIRDLQDAVAKHEAAQARPAEATLAVALERVAALEHRVAELERVLRGRRSAA